MAVAVSAAYNNSYHSPGFDITVTGLSGYNELLIERVDPSGEYPDTPVRGADHVAIADASFAITDFEAPIGKDFRWRVTASGTATGSTVYTDTFTRTVSNGWGASADLTWTLQHGTAANASVDGSAALGSITTNNDPLTLTITPVLSDFDFSFDFRTSDVSTGAQIVAAFFSGYQDADNQYRWEFRFMPDSTLDVLIRRNVSGTLVNLAVHNDAATYSAGTWYSARCYAASGAMKIKVWLQGDPEPGTWWIETTDSTFTSGLIGLSSYTGSANSNTKPVTVSFDNVALPGSGGTTIISETVLSGLVAGISASNVGTAWLKSVGTPELSRRVNVVDFNDISLPGRILGEYEVLGRSNKVVLSDVLGGREGSITFATFAFNGVWESDCNTKDLTVLARYGGTLLLQTAGANLTGEEDMYFEIKDFSRKRIGVIGSSMTHLHQIQFIEVDRPATTEEALSLRNWGDVVTQNATWADVLTNYTSWLDLLQRDI